MQVDGVTPVGHECVVLAIYGPMINTAPYVKFLMRAYPLQGPVEGLGHEEAKLGTICKK